MLTFLNLMCFGVPCAGRHNTFVYLVYKISQSLSSRWQSTHPIYLSHTYQIKIWLSS